MERQVAKGQRDWSSKQTSSFIISSNKFLQFKRCEITPTSLIMSKASMIKEEKN